MRGRRPRYRRQELEGLSIPQVRNLARGQNVNIAGCLEKADIVRCLLDSGTIEVVEAEIPSYDAEELSNMGLRQLRSLMLQAGIGTEGCLEKADLLDRIASSRLVTVTHGEEVPPPPPPSFGYGGGSSGGGSAARQSPQRGAGAGAGAAAAPPARGRGGMEETRWAEPNSNAFSRAGLWWRRAGRRGGGGGSSAERAATQAGAAAASPPPPPPPQARAAAPAAPGAGASAVGAGAAAARPLENMSVKELREITNRLGVSTAGCLEKRDMVERIRSCGRYREAAGVGRP
ncbi:unnamed protein product [Ectocarpus fasciculatus]